MPKKLPTLFFLITIVILCITIPMRVILVRSYTDPLTGFYTGAYTSAVLALNLILVVGALILLVPLFIPKQAVPTVSLPQQNTALGVLSGLGALALLAASVGQFASLVTTNTSGGLFLDALFTIAAAAYFAVQARALFSGRRPHAMAVLLPVVWATVHLVVSWMHYTTVTNVPNQLFDVLKMVAFMLFWYYHARLMSGVSNGREYRGVLSFGLLAVCFGLLSAVPPLLVRLSDGTTASFSMTDSLATVVLCLYILVLFGQLFLGRAAMDTHRARSAA